jgi:hypothetical protein
MLASCKAVASTGRSNPCILCEVGTTKQYEITVPASETKAIETLVAEADKDASLRATPLHMPFDIKGSTYYCYAAMDGSLMLIKDKHGTFKKQ